MDINGVIQNLSFSKSSPLRKEYSSLFVHLTTVKTDRNWIIHKQNIHSSKERWAKVWNTINIDIKQSLSPELDRVIEKERERLYMNNSERTNVNETQMHRNSAFKNYSERIPTMRKERPGNDKPNTT